MFLMGRDVDFDAAMAAGDEARASRLVASYLALCGAPDAGTGMPHFALGMARAFTVG